MKAINSAKSEPVEMVDMPEAKIRRSKNMRSVLLIPENLASPLKKKCPINFEDIRIIKRIDKGKCLIYFAKHKSKNECYAVKVFPCPTFQKMSLFFKNEIRFKNLNHPHIIKILASQENIKFIQDFKPIEASCVIMDYASNGDLCQEMLSKNIFEKDEILIRTYFHELIEGLEYLHDKGIHHLDIKLDNLFLDENFILKIGDFDNSHFNGDPILSRGTLYYRAPELARSKCADPVKADVYSAGVVLFTMMSNGFFPTLEDNLFEGYNLLNLFATNLEAFWTVHTKFLGKGPHFYTKDFRTLINGMLAIEPEERLGLEEVKASKWYRGVVYEDEQLKDIMSNKN
jgi:serine/threonine protein kinase